jgi:hypothetical protein
MTVVADPLIVKARAIMNRPGFNSALATHSDAMFKLYKDAQVAGAQLARFLVNETARALIANLCIYLDLTFEPGDPRSGLTIRKIQKICVDRDVASPGRAFAFLKMMQLSGYLEAVPVSDKRVKLLRPTRKLRSYRSELMHSIYSALDHVAPGADYACRGASPAVDRSILLVSGKDFFGGLLLLDYHPDIKMFADRDGGYHFLLKILREARLFSGDAPAEKISISLQDASRRSGLSRSHLRSILLEAERRELIAFETGASNRIRLTPKLIEEFKEQVALLLAYYADVMDRRLDEPCPILFQGY